jgi:radical SAM superfamily enzyme YgiQ (UPF0313 family)
MKILFSNPPWWEQAPATAHEPAHLRQGIRAGSRWPFTRHATHAPDDFRFGGYLPFPFFMGYAASYTQREFPAAQVLFRDSIARGESYNSWLIAVLEFAPDWIVIETATPAWPHDEELLRKLRQVVPGARVILAGPVDCARHQAILANHPNVAALVQGEYDKQVAKVIRQGGGYPTVVGHDLLSVAEMNAAPPPMFDEACATHYADGCPAGQQFPQLQVWTSRGCPFKCSFCVWPATMTGHDPDGTRPRAVRSYSPEYLERFLRGRLALAAEAGTPYRSIYIDDDTFNLTNRHVEAVAPVMAAIGLPWSAMCRADTLSDVNWKLMRDSGCFGVKIGCESGSQRVLDQVINKRLSLHDVEHRWLPLLRSLGFTVHTTWTIGIAGETPAEAQETRAMIARLYAAGLHATHQLSGTAEIEGTPLHTLRTAGHLAKYPGLHHDEHYHPSPDGQRKIEGLA